jgi:hypothetical protein
MNKVHSSFPGELPNEISQSLRQTGQSLIHGGACEVGEATTNDATSERSSGTLYHNARLLARPLPKGHAR